MKIHDLLIEGKKTLKNFSPTASLDAEILLSHCAGIRNTQLISEPEKEVDKKTIKEFRQFLESRRRGVPVPYLINSKEFFKRRFFVNEDVLIPRPETEELVNFALTYLSKNKEISQVYDIGTGSGAIAISIALDHPQKKIYATDISEKALGVAKKNALLLSAKNVTFFQSNLLSEIETTFEKSLIIANLPYIGTVKHADINEHTKKYEPSKALFSGFDGLDHYRKLLSQLKEKNSTNSSLIMEMASGQATELKKIITDTFPNADSTVHQDLAHLDRFISVVF